MTNATHNDSGSVAQILGLCLLTGITQTLTLDISQGTPVQPLNDGRVIDEQALCEQDLLT